MVIFVSFYRNWSSPLARSAGLPTLCSNFLTIMLMSYAKNSHCYAKLCSHLLFNKSIEFYFKLLITQITFSRVSSRLLREKNRMRAILKESTANYISLESLINVDFRKIYELPVFLIPQKKIAKMTAKMTMRHSGKQMN